MRKRSPLLSTQSKAKELLSEIDAQISGIERSLKGLQAQRKEVAKLVKSLSGSSPTGARRGRPAGKRTRTNWDRVIASFKGSFSIDDLAKASKKSKGTVNQAIQNLKKAKKIKPTGKRGEYQRVGAVAKPKIVKKKTAKKKAVTKPQTKKKVQAKKATPKAPQPASGGNEAKTVGE